ncbi:MAG: hypothetical protein KC422_09290 [Trueperaceae bacterium]|nr:hypothetical protein [Trueperaceae bacterium]
MKYFKIIIITIVVVGLLTGCSKLERNAKKLVGGLSEIISEGVNGVIQATVKIIFLSVLSTQEDGTQALSFEAETPSGRAFKGIAVGATNALSSGEVAIKGRAFEVQGEPVLLANAINSEGSLPLVMIAVETDTLITQPSLGRSLSDVGTLELVAQSLNQGNNSPTIFRFIGETEKNLSLLGIGLTRLDLNAGTQGELLDWQASGDMRLEGSIIETSLGATLEAGAELRLTAGEKTQVVNAQLYSFVVQKAQ